LLRSEGFSRSGSAAARASVTGGLRLRAARSSLEAAALVPLRVVAADRLSSLVEWTSEGASLGAVGADGS
jgi:hypothetical protein